MTAGLTLMKIVFISSAKTILIPSELSAGMSAQQMQLFYSNICIRSSFRLSFMFIIALVVSNQEIKDIMKINKSLEESGVLTKRN